KVKNEKIGGRFPEQAVDRVAIRRFAGNRHAVDGRKQELEPFTHKSMIVSKDDTRKLEHKAYLLVKKPTACIMLAFPSQS
ncbi:hypothetical protein GY644_25125, partial [Escherichia coli]|nr:hypothetical protein [Escherichia coli]